MKNEIQAIVLAAGPGSRLTPLSNTTQKCLLPILNYPMLVYPLYFLQKSGFQEVTVIVSSGKEKDVQKLVEQFNLQLKLDIVSINTNEDPGTADSLRHIQSKIKKTVDEIVLMSCDLVTDADFLKIMDQHRLNGASLTILTSTHNNAFIKGTAPGPKTKLIFNNDIICTNSKRNNQLVYYVAGGDYDEAINISHKILENIESTLEINSNLLDSHLYIIGRSLLEYVLNKCSSCENMGSLKAEIIPYIISQQNKCKSSFSDDSPFVSHNKYDTLVSEYNTSVKSSRYSCLAPTTSLAFCHYYHHPGVCVRVNTMPAYWMINRENEELLRKFFQDNFENMTAANFLPKFKSHPGSVIGRDASIGDGSCIENSVVGSHCRIEGKVAIRDSLVYDHVEVCQGVTIEKSIICVNVNVPCKITNCILTHSSCVQTNGIYKDELLILNDFTE